MNPYDLIKPKLDVPPRFPHAEVGLRGTSIDLCVDDYAFDLTRPAGFAFFGSISRSKHNFES